MKKTLFAVFFFGVTAGFASPGNALQIYEPQYSTWGWTSGGAVVVMLGRLCGITADCGTTYGVRVVFQNNNPADPSYRNCQFVDLPNVLTDNIIIRGGAGNDVVVLNPISPMSVKCGGGVYVPYVAGVGNGDGSSFAYFLANQTYWAGAQGGAGDDYISLGMGTGYSLCYGHGMDGNDKLHGSGEGVDFYGGNGNDNLRESNNIAGISPTNQTWLHGQEGNDCVQADSTNCGSGSANMVCGGGAYDVRSTVGTCAINYATCEATTPAWCMYRGPGVSCTSSTYCDSSVGSTCVSGICTQWW